MALGPSTWVGEDPPGSEARCLSSLPVTPPPPPGANGGSRAPELWWAAREAKGENLVNSPPRPLLFFAAEPLQHDSSTSHRKAKICPDYR
jgi:hypothetical protein